MAYELDEIKNKVDIALGILYKNDFSLLENYVHERSISHKLAEYLQHLFRDYHVDCEYNLKGLETKELPDIRECSEDKKTDRVVPDIIIHIRGSDDNLLVIEMKSKNDDSVCDIEKLKLFTSDDGNYKYILGLFIKFENASHSLRWFHHGNEE